MEALTFGEIKNIAIWLNMNGSYWLAFKKKMQEKIRWKNLCQILIIIDNGSSKKFEHWVLLNGKKNCSYIFTKVLAS